MESFFKAFGQENMSFCNRSMSQRYLDSITNSIGEGNGTPLQYSCLENPMDGGAWWATVHGVAQSRTRLKRLSSSNQLNEHEFEQILEDSGGQRSLVQSMEWQRVGHNLVIEQHVSQVGIPFFFFFLNFT